MTGRFRGTWYLGLSYSMNDIVICNNAYYKAINDRPCYDDPPDINADWKWLRDRQSKDNTPEEC